MGYKWKNKKPTAKNDKIWAPKILENLKKINRLFI